MAYLLQRGAAREHLAFELFPLKMFSLRDILETIQFPLKRTRNESVFLCKIQREEQKCRRLICLYIIIILTMDPSDNQNEQNSSSSSDEEENEKTVSANIQKLIIEVCKQLCCYSYVC